MEALSLFAEEIVEEINYETCISCQRKTDVRKDTHVDFRENYIYGLGQLCRACGQN